MNQRVKIVGDDTNDVFVGRTGTIITILRQPPLKDGRPSKAASHPYLVDIDGIGHMRWYSNKELEAL